MMKVPGLPSVGETDASREPSLMERLRADLVSLRCMANDHKLSVRSMRGRLLLDLPPTPAEIGPAGTTIPNRPETSAVSFQDIVAELERINAELREVIDHFAALRKIG